MYVEEYINLRLLHKLQAALSMQNGELLMPLLFHKEIKLYYYTGITNCDPLKHSLRTAFTQRPQNIWQMSALTL